MDELVALLIVAIDDLQIARQYSIDNEENAFETLIAVRNDVETAYYA